MRDSYRTRCSWSTVLVLLAFIPTLARAGEGTPKSTQDTNTPVKEPCFTLLNPKQIPADASAEKRLATARIRVHIDGQISTEVLIQFGQTIGVPVALDFGASDPDKWINPDEQLDCTVRDVSARGYLDYLFFAMGFDGKFYWSIRDGRLVVAPGDAEKQVIRKVYDVTKLLTPPERFRKDNAGKEDMIELIQTVVEPESWSEVGGVGTVSFMELPGAKVLVVRNCRKAQEQVAALLKILDEMLDAKTRDGCRSIHEKLRHRFRKAMEQKVTLDAKKSSLAEILTSIEKQTAQPVVFDREGVKDLGHDADSTVSYRGKDRSLRAIQDELLREVGAVFVPRFDMILLTSPEHAERWCETTVFEVTDLLTFPEYPSYGYDYDSLNVVIRTTVEPDVWACVDGIGWPKELTLHGRAFLVIRQNEKTTEKIEKLLHGFRVIQAGKATHYPPPSEEDRALAKKLKKKADWHIEKGTTLPGLLTELKRRHGIDGRMDKTGFSYAGYAPDSPIKTPLCVKDCSAEMLLDLLLTPMDLTWCIRHGRLAITSTEEMDCMLFTEIYEVTDLVIPGDVDTRIEMPQKAKASPKTVLPKDSSGSTDTPKPQPADFDALMESVKKTVPPEDWSDSGNAIILGPGQRIRPRDLDFDSLAELIKITIHPESWSEVGGGATALIPPLSFGNRNVLVIRQSKKIHKDIARFLADLRATMPKDAVRRRIMLLNVSQHSSRNWDDSPYSGSEPPVSPAACGRSSAKNE